MLEHVDDSKIYSLKKVPHCFGHKQASISDFEIFQFDVKVIFWVKVEVIQPSASSLNRAIRHYCPECETIALRNSTVSGYFHAAIEAFRPIHQMTFSEMIYFVRIWMFNKKQFIPSFVTITILAAPFHALIRSISVQAELILTSAKATEFSAFINIWQWRILSWSNRKVTVGSYQCKPVSLQVWVPLDIHICKSPKYFYNFQDTAIFHFFRIHQRQYMSGYQISIGILACNYIDKSPMCCDSCDHKALDAPGTHRCRDKYVDSQVPLDIHKRRYNCTSRSY